MPKSKTSLLSTLGDLNLVDIVSELVGHPLVFAIQFGEVERMAVKSSFAAIGRWMMTVDLHRAVVMRDREGENLRGLYLVVEIVIPAIAQSTGNLRKAVSCVSAAMQGCSGNSPTP